MTPESNQMPVSCTLLGGSSTFCGKVLLVNSHDLQNKIFGDRTDSYSWTRTRYQGSFSPVMQRWGWKRSGQTTRAQGEQFGRFVLESPAGGSTGARGLPNPRSPTSHPGRGSEGGVSRAEVRGSESSTLSESRFLPSFASG